MYIQVSYCALCKSHHVLCNIHSFCDIILPWFYFFLGVKAQLPSLVFTSDTYNTYVTSNTAIGDRVQQVIAIAHPYVPTITYSLEENDYVEINSTTGDVSMKAAFSASTGSLSFVPWPGAKYMTFSYDISPKRIFISHFS